HRFGAVDAPEEKATRLIDQGSTDAAWQTSGAANVGRQGTERQHQAIAGHKRRRRDELWRDCDRRHAGEENEAEKEEDSDERKLLPHRRGVERLRPRPMLGRLVLDARS